MTESLIGVQCRATSVGKNTVVAVFRIMFEIPMRREQSFGYSALFLKEYSCYFKLCIDTKSNPILFPQTKRQQTLRYFQDFVGNSAEDGRFIVLMQIDVEILPLQREPTPPQRRVHAR